MSLDDQPGLLLPHNVVQPFFLRYQPDDLHVIAFIAGHPAYEAVEAMIRRRADGGADIRAIITRHDQSHVDHINSAAGMAQVRGAARDYRECDIAFTEETRSDIRRVRVAFASFAGENIELEITTLGLPTTRASGLTDPGAHSVTSALPMMWRGASALGGPQTRIVIDGRRYEAPPGPPIPGAETRKAFFTERFSMGVLRAGETALRILRSPSLIGPGAEWMYENEGEAIVYRIVERSDRHVLRIERPDSSGETVSAVAVGNRLRLLGVRVDARGEPARALVLAFDEPHRFRFDMEDERALVAGLARIDGNSDGCTIGLEPDIPDWARARNVRVACSSANDMLRYATTIGE